MTLDTILEEIKKAEKIVILAHEGPDGDAIGSAIAFNQALKSLGKNPDVIIPEYSKNFDFLPDINAIKKSSNVKKYDLAIALDCADSKILKGYTEYFEKASKKIVIDHHSSNTMFGDINFVNPVAPACCQILIGMFEYFEIEITKEIGECIMTGIVTDTGGFSHNTTYETFEFAAEIMRLGVNISQIFRRGLYTRNKANLELHKKAMNRLEFLENGKIAFTYITEEDLKEVNAMQGDHEGIVELGRNVENVEVSIFLHATKNNCYKVSLRSQDYVDVANIAIMLGGGGHQKAAAATVKGTIEQIKDKVIAEVKKQL